MQTGGSHGGKGSDGFRGQDHSEGAGKGPDGTRHPDRPSRAYSPAEARVAETLLRHGQQPGDDPIGQLIENTLALLEYRAAHEAPGWTYEGPHSAGGHLSDAEVAGRIRMLMRDSLDHEGVCVMARDRIRDLSREVAALKARLAAAEAKA